MPMKMGWRWYGEGNDPVTLSDIKQIPGVTSIVWALHNKMPGEIWEIDEIQKVADQIHAYGFDMDVVESVNVHDDIKIGLPTRDKYIENYKQCIRNLSKFGVKVICYNFMPVFDWTRTEMAKELPDGSTTLSFDAAEVAKTRHIAIKEINSQSNGYFVNSVTVRVRTNKGEHAIVGVLFNGTEAKIVQIDEYRVDFTPEGYLLLVPHVDQPNMIGQISTILGQAHINIMGMQVGRMTKSGNNIMAIAVQDDIPNDIMVKLRSINGILDMKLIHCDIH